MEKNNSKQSGLFQSMASKISRFFKRDSSAASPTPVTPTETVPEEDKLVAPETPSVIAEEPQTQPVPDTPADVDASPAVVAPVPEEKPALQEEKHTEVTPEVNQEPIVNTASELMPEKEVAPQEPVSQIKREPLSQQPHPVHNRPATEVAATSTPKEPSAPVSISALTSKRRLRISDLSHGDAEILLSTYVQEHISDEQLSVETMAAQLKISRTGLYQLVHDIFDVTPANYILDCRLKYASELLLTGKKVRDVSSKCGFSDPKYFSKVFKKYYGVLPSNYGAVE